MGADAGVDVDGRSGVGAEMGEVEVDECDEVEDECEQAEA